MTHSTDCRLCGATHHGAPDLLARAEKRWGLERAERVWQAWEAAREVAHPEAFSDAEGVNAR